jgi:hypothetical protein
MLTEMKTLDELIAAGWGHVPQDLIPPDWKKRSPPDENIGKEDLAGELDSERAAASEPPHWIHFETHSRFHAVYFQVRYHGAPQGGVTHRFLTYCGREVDPDHVHGETEKPAEKCSCCRRRMRRAYLIPEGLRRWKEAAGDC